MVQSCSVQSADASRRKQVAQQCVGHTSLLDERGCQVLAPAHLVERYLGDVWPPGLPPAVLMLKQGQLVRATSDLGPRVTKGALFVIDHVGARFLRVVEVAAYGGEGFQYSTEELKYPGEGFDVPLDASPVHLLPRIVYEWPMPVGKQRGRRQQFPVVPAYALAAKGLLEAGDCAALDLTTPPRVGDRFDPQTFEPLCGVPLRDSMKLVADMDLHCRHLLRACFYSRSGQRVVGVNVVAQGQ